MSDKACRRCGKAVTQKSKALCNKCLADDKRLERQVNPEVRKRDQERYAKKKDDPEFIKKNRERARLWKLNKKKNK